MYLYACIKKWNYKSGCCKTDAQHQTFPLDTEAATAQWLHILTWCSRSLTTNETLDTKLFLSVCLIASPCLNISVISVCTQRIQLVKGNGWVGFPVVQVSSPCYSSKQNGMTFKFGKMNVPTYFCLIPPEKVRSETRQQLVHRGLQTCCYLQWTL